MKDHQLAKTERTMSKPTSQCAQAFATDGTTSIQDTENSTKDKLNAKVVVSIQSNEEKSKENFLGSEFVNFYFSCLLPFFLIVFIVLFSSTR